MFKTEARKIAEDNLRVARESGDAATITSALAEYTRLVEKEDRIRARRARTKKKRDETKAKEAPTPPDDGDEPWMICDFYIGPVKEHPSHCVCVFVPPPEPPPTPEQEAARKRAEEAWCKEQQAKQEIDAPATPAAQSFGYDQLPYCGPPNGFPFLVAGETCVASHRFSGGEWEGERARREQAEQDAYWKDYMEKICGR